MSNSDERRKKFWEEDEEEDTGWVAPKPGTGSGSVTKASDSEEIDKKINETRILMDQTHQLYLQYFGGIERRPPIEKARLLEGKILELQRLNVTLTTAKFKISQFISQYKVMRELWERKLKDMERK